MIPGVTEKLERQMFGALMSFCANRNALQPGTSCVGERDAGQRADDDF